MSGGCHKRDLCWRSGAFLSRWCWTTTPMSKSIATLRGVMLAAVMAGLLHAEVVHQQAASMWAGNVTDDSVSIRFWGAMSRCMSFIRPRARARAHHARFHDHTTSTRTRKIYARTRTRSSASA